MPSSVCAWLYILILPGVCDIKSPPPTSGGRWAAPGPTTSMSLPLGSIVECAPLPPCGEVLMAVGRMLATSVLRSNSAADPRAKMESRFNVIFCRQAPIQFSADVCDEPAF